MKSILKANVGWMKGNEQLSVICVKGNRGDESTERSENSAGYLYNALYLRRSGRTRFNEGLDRFTCHPMDASSSGVSRCLPLLPSHSVIALRPILGSVRPAKGRRLNVPWNWPHTEVVCGPCLLWPNGWTDQDTTWYGGRTRPTRHCIRWREIDSSPLPLSGPRLLWPNGRPSQQLLRSC